MSDLLRFSRRSVLAMPLALAACKWGESVFRLTGATMGTTYSIVAIDKDRALSEPQIRRAVEAALRDVDTQMSNWNPESELSRFNTQTGTAPVSVSPDLARVMTAAETVHLASDGRFDTTMGPLIELWGFGAPGAGTMPSDTAVADAMARSGHARMLAVGPDTMQKRAPDAQVYLAGIGKGHGADHVGRALKGLGLSDYLVEIGGDVYAAGVNPDGLPWQIGVETPQALGGGVFKVVGLSGLGLATSGDYRNYFERDGRRFSHLIDPGTGHPITHRTASATVLAENAMLADAWSTAMLTLGRTRGMEIAQERGLAVLFIDRETEGAEPTFRAATSPLFDQLTG